MSDSDEFDFASKFKKAQAKIQSNFNFDLSLEGPDLISTKTDSLDKSITQEKIISNNIDVINIDSDSDCDIRQVTDNSKATRSKARNQTINLESNPINTHKEQRYKKTRKQGTKNNNCLLNNNAVVTVSSDSELECIIDELDKSQEEDDLNDEQTVLIKWIFVKNYRIPLRRFQKLSVLQEELAKYENVPSDNIRLMLKNKELDPKECLHSLNITVTDVIDAFPASKETNFSSCSEKAGLKFKIQTKNAKKPLFIQIKPSDMFHVLFRKVSEELGNIPLSKLKFRFDGDILKPDKTADEQDLEGGECIDLEIIEK